MVAKRCEGEKAGSVVSIGADVDLESSRQTKPHAFSQAWSLDQSESWATRTSTFDHLLMSTI